MTTLKNELVGTWQLLSYIEVPINGTDSKFPMGQNPKGLLIYGADGYMSVQISNSERGNFSSDDRYLAKEEELKSQVKGFIALAGTYKIDNMNAIVQYAITTSSFPNWEGQIQERKIDFEGDILYLKSVDPILSDGIKVNSYMTWRRVEKEEYLSRRERFMEITASKQSKTQFEDFE
ncbi:lipocalin-like domain-containing protein [Sphingobacterium endophyticum]|uniref:lipocalin-like domain-containing protein n=1 Tax=Sphingobacterium endophyticum TaxID=2546448 RepID=UPI0012E21FC3|nr:lipocalin-like domain-containing protein [Sphingobacterium endophyticum]